MVWPDCVYFISMSQGNIFFKKTPVASDSDRKVVAMTKSAGMGIPYIEL